MTPVSMNSILSLILVVLAASFAPTKLWAKPIALIIHVNDGNKAVDQKQLEYTKAILEAGLPNHQIEVAEVGLDYNEADPEVIEEAQEQLRHEINKIVSNSRYKISHLIINTHGGRFDNAGGGYFILRGLGRLTTYDSDEDLDYTLSPLQGKMRKGAQITINACSTFCGKSHLNVLLAEKLAKILETPNARIFGATQESVSDRWIYDQESRELIGKRFSFFRRLPMMVLPYLAGLFVSLPVLNILKDMANQYPEYTGSGTFLTFTGLAVALPILSGLAFKLAQKQIITEGTEEFAKEYIDEYSSGVMYSLRNGKVVNTTPLFKHQSSDYNQAYGLECGIELQRQAH